MYRTARINYTIVYWLVLFMSYTSMRYAKYTYSQDKNVYSTDLKMTTY